jgi:hypothetical protein
MAWSTLENRSGRFKIKIRRQIASVSWIRRIRGHH